MTKQIRFAILGFGLLAVSGCNTDMWRQPKQDPLDESTFYADGAANRPLVPGTIPRGYLREDDAYYVGAQNGKWLDGFPVGIKVNLALIKRGQDRYNIYCTPCHGRIGDGQGMIAHRGFTLKRPVGDYQTERLRKLPAGHFYDVITNGYGAMFSYASRVEPQDRWAIVAYIRALQLSQYATPADVSPEDMQKLTAENNVSNGRLAQK